MSVKDDLDDGLTDEERAALAEEDGAEESTTEADTETGAEADDQQEAAKDDKPAAEAAAADAGKQADEPAAAEEASPAQQQPAPLLVATAPEDAEARLSEIATKKDALLEQFDNGDITAREYQKGLDDLNKQERTLELDLREAKLAEKMEQQRAQNDWVSTCNRFIEANPVYKENPRLYRALDAEVRELAAKPESANWSGQKFLDEAHKNLAEAFNLPAAKGAAPTPAPKPKPKVDLPPNLAKVPSAEVEDTSGNRFAVLDRMATSDPLGYEDALAKMSQADRDAYLAG